MTEPTPAPAQRVIKIRRDYNAWVADETKEDYALRFAPRTFRKWSAARVANTAFGAASFLILEAVGATLLLQHGFTNAALAILATGLIIFLAGLPISVYAARHGVDMDLLTRGAGFGYIGSTLTSLIYASFTFIFFALEAAVMAYALELAFDIPPAWGYVICSLVVIPLVTHGVTLISRLQVWTQPLWLALLIWPYVYVFDRNPGLLDGLRHYGGERGLIGFDPLAFGAATTVGIALITQMGEQADYLRFMPEPRDGRWRSRLRWWGAVVIGGPGWVIPGVLKMLGGALLAWLALGQMVPADRAVDPNQMYLTAYEMVFSRPGWAVAATALLVLVSQLKINVTNAYAGSLAWSNFFSRVAHSHPGRVVWVVFNTGIALALMELDVFQALGGVLGLYANLAISWMMAVVADLVINKPMGWSPRGIEFRRAYLYDINPVGVGAMAAASLLSVTAHLGLFGPMAQAYSALIALVTALAVSPLIAWATQGRYYLARSPQAPAPDALQAEPDADHGAYAIGRPGVLRLPAVARCVICERSYEAEDMAGCPAYGGPICSLCCTLDVRCHDMCKPHGRLSVQWSAALRRLLPAALWPYLDKGLSHFVLLMLAVTPLLALVFGVLYQQELRQLAPGWVDSPAWPALADSLRSGYVKAYAALLLVAGVVAWWLVLAQQSRHVAQEESNRQTEALQREIESHRRTDLQLQAAKQQAEEAQQQAERAREAADSARASADAANQAKSRYITAISHELRTPLNSILGYAQLLEEDAAMPAHRQQAVSVIRRGGDHLLSLIEGTLDLARIEGGKLTLAVAPMRLGDSLQEIARLFQLQAQSKGIGFVAELDAALPVWVRADEKRLRQILINLLGNAVKFTSRGEVRLTVAYAREMARIEIRDSGPGMSAAELARVFEPFERGSSAGAAAGGGTGLGLTISRMLVNLMGGELSAESTPGVGSVFRLKFFLPEVQVDAAQAARLTAHHGPARTGYLGPRRRVLVVDNEEADRGLLLSVLQPLGFELLQAASGEAALALLAGLTPAQRPHAVFMDLAMPGIDGWETLRRARAQGLMGAAPAAIVSANAFDRGLDNDVGITPADFFVKPVRVPELLDWLGQRLGLDWTRAAAPVAGPLADPAAPAQAPPVADLQRLAELVQLGYPRGVLRELDRIEQAHAGSAAFIAPLRALAQQFRFDALAEAVAEALTAADPTPQAPRA
jgi:signal transduction histidine kinase/purine-cytosine permease-like protein